jgi:hypothetical protein
MMFDGWGEQAAEKYRATWVDLEQCVSSFGQVDRLDEPSVQSAGLADMGIEIGEALDLDQTASHDAAFCQAHDLPSMPGEIMVEMTAANDELVAWLLEGDPSIRWRVH